MRILYWTEVFWPHIGGVEVLSKHFIPAMQERGYEFAVVTSHHDHNLPDESVYDDIPVYRFHFRTSLERGDLKQLKAALQKVAMLKESFKPDLVHINHCGPSVFFHLITINICHSPMLVTIHAWHSPKSRHNTLLERMLCSAGWVNAPSGALLDKARNLVPEITARSSVIHNALNMPSLEPAPLSFDEPRLLCLGRVVNDKGFDLALDAFAGIVVRYPKARLIVAGDGPARPELEQRAASLGILNAVEFTGWVAPSKVFDLINTATIVIVPSRWHEPFGLVALEAAQMARPVVATSVGGLPEVVVHQETGLLVEKDDVAQLIEAIAFLLDNPEVATRIGQAARVRSQEVFNLERFVDAYDALYRKLIR